MFCSPSFLFLSVVFVDRPAAVKCVSTEEYHDLCVNISVLVSCLG
jgi:hypothetical protein